MDSPSCTCCVPEFEPLNEMFAKRVKKEAHVDICEEAVYADFSMMCNEQDKKEEYVPVQDLGYNLCQSPTRSIQKCQSSSRSIHKDPKTEILSAGYGNQIKCLKQRKPIELFGLSQPELNGKKGFLVAFDTEMMHWKVNVEGQPFLIKPENIKTPSFYSRFIKPKEEPSEVSGILAQCLIDRKPVELHVQSQPGLKGKKGFLLELDSKQKKWKVKVNGLTLFIRPEDIKPAHPNPCTSRFTLEELASPNAENPSEDSGILSKCLREKKPVELFVLSQPGLKCKKGFLVEFDNEKGKWKVKVNGLSLLINPEDIRPAYGYGPCPSHTRFEVTLANYSLEDF